MEKLLYRMILSATMLLFSTSLIAQERHGLRASIGFIDAGKAKFKSPLGDAYRMFKGTVADISYINISENKLVLGVGYKAMNAETFKEGNPYFNFDIISYQTAFPYGLIGYEFFDHVQLNLKLGEKTTSLHAKTSYDVDRTSPIKTDFKGSVSNIDYDFNIFVTGSKENIKVGFNLCYCEINAKFSKDSSTYEVTIGPLIFSIVFDFYF